MDAPATDWPALVRQRVNEELERYLSRKRSEVERLCPESLELVDAVHSLTMRGGKRLRAVVVAAGYKAVKPEASLDRCLCPGAAVEMLQSFLLIHDDWMDEDATRRGGPSVHMMLREKRQDPHLGDCLAILAGDLAGAYAFDLCFESPFPIGRKQDAMRAFLRMQQEVFLGQYLDLTGASSVTRMHELKTGSYTVLGPLVLGALLGGAEDSQVEALTAFARPLGLAFQLRDDLLGTFGRPESTGKPVGGDLRAGKRNAVREESEKALKGPAREAFDAVFGRAEASDTELEAVTHALLDAGVAAAIERRLKQQCDEAQRLLDDAPFEPAGRAYLAQISSALTRRNH